MQLTAKEKQLKREWRDLQLRHATAPKFAQKPIGSTLKKEKRDEQAIRPHAGSV